MGTAVSHYTFGHKLSAILSTGALLPTGVTIPRHERKSLWYSANLRFEPTALKPLKMPWEIEPRRATMEELHEVVGLYRFVADTDVLRVKHWPQACREIGIALQDARRLVEVGRQLGANPEDWWATVHPKPLALHTFERWTGDRWEPADLDDEVTKRQDLAVRSSADGTRWSDLRR
jgi:hypothetical protein